MPQKRSDFYTRLRRRIREWLRSEQGRTNRWAEYVLVAPDFFHLLCKLAVDPEVPISQKAKLAGAIVYFVSPLDLLPEALTGPVGYLDDIVLAAWVLDGIVNKTGPEIVQRHWAGERDVLERIQKVLQMSDQMLGSGLLRRLKKLLG